MKRSIFSRMKAFGITAALLAAAPACSYDESCCDGSCTDTGSDGYCTI